MIVLEKIVHHAKEGLSPYSLGKLIDWKPNMLQRWFSNTPPEHSLLAREIN
jgi:hypothetical protein